MDAHLLRSDSPLLLLARQASPAARRLARSSVTSREFKVLLIGQSGVGKTSLCRREALDEFAPTASSANEPLVDDFKYSSNSTAATERFTTTVEVRQEPIDLLLFDTVGQERFMTLPTVLYRNANAILICFDVSTNRTSFDRIDQWFLDAERNAPRDALMLLVRTKADLPQRVVGEEECKNKAAELGVHLFETSARSGRNVKAMFQLIASQLSEENRAYDASSMASLGTPPAPVVSLPMPPASPPSVLPRKQESSCWHPSFFFSSDSGEEEDDASLPDGREEEDSLEHQGLAQVILHHANQRAISVAGGLRRREREVGNMLDPPGRHVAAATAAAPWRTCTLGCGAITNVASHEREECWLRSVSCSLNCGKSFPMLDCAAHEREQCELRYITCACGDRIQAKHLSLHQDQEEMPETRQEMIHFLQTLFPTRELLRRNVNLREVKTAREEDLTRALLTPEAQREVEQALQRFKGYGAVWQEEEDVKRGFALKSVVSLQRRNQLMKRPPSVVSVNAATAGTLRRRRAGSNASSSSNNCDEEEAFSQLWQDLIEYKIAPSFAASEEALVSSNQTMASSKTRDVQVPLTLGSRVVTVRTIDFADLHDLNSANKLGVGSFGSVYLAKYRGAQVAVKHLHFQNLSERELLREAAVMTSCCHHPHILRFLGVCLDRPNICFVSEALVCSLEDWLRFDKRNQAEPLQEILRFAEEAASGLFHLHLESIVHRDIAARNLLLDTGTPRRVKVCDFGLARVVAKQQRVYGSSSNTTSASSPPAMVTGGSFDLTGPLKWMAPECLKVNDGLNCFSFASDVYSFAITLWELISRDTPYPELTPLDAATQVLAHGLRPPRAKLRNTAQLHALLQQDAAAVSPRIALLLERAWDANAVNRPTMKQICSELGALQDALLEQQTQQRDE